jgi:hypothetical protein
MREVIIACSFPCKQRKKEKKRNGLDNFLDLSLCAATATLP